MPQTDKTTTHTLRFVVAQEPPGKRPMTLLELIARAWPEASAADHREALERDRVRLDGRVIRDGKRGPLPGSLVEVDASPGHEGYGDAWSAEELVRGEAWFVVEKPVGMTGVLDRDDAVSPILYTADMLGADRATFTPAWPLPAAVGGPWLCAADEAGAAALEAAWRSGQLMLTFTALCPRLERPHGQLVGSDEVKVMYSVTRHQGGLSEVQLIPQFGLKGADSAVDPVTLCLEALAMAGHPAVCDRARGGLLGEGALRLRLTALVDEAFGLAHSWSMPPEWWPTAPLIPLPPEPEDADDEASDEASSDDGAPGEVVIVGSDDPRLQMRAPRGFKDVKHFMISTQTLEIIERGHPWVLPDRDTSSREDFATGEVVRLRTPRGKLGPYALVEGPGDIAARVWAWEDEAVAEFIDEIDLRVDEALVRRAELLRETDRTDLFRLIHAEADGLPGFYLDRVGPLLRATITSHAARAFKWRIYENLTAMDPHMMLLEVAHLDDVRSRGELPRARIMHARGEFAREGVPVTGVEAGLRYECSPWEGIDVGFFSDQRLNRATLSKLARPGQTWINLFGHTGAFNVVLASRGARVINVDISQKYLDWTARNIALNRIDPALSEGSALDARVFMSQLEEPVAGIILDPPTAAQSDAGFWTVHKGYEALLEQCIKKLQPNGLLLACRNTRKKKTALPALIRSIAASVDRRVITIEAAPPAPDYPNLAGFPEGDAFEGWLARIA